MNPLALSRLISLLTRRWPARPAVGACAVPMLFGALVLTGCGGSSGPASTDTPPPPPVARTAPALTVTPQPQFAASGPGSYQEALQNYQQVGEVLHGQ